MSIEAMMWVKKHAPTENSTEMCILYALSDRANDDGTGCWPYYETLADEARCSVPTVKRHVKELERRGLIKRGDQGQVSSYPKYRRPIVWDLNMRLRREPVEKVSKSPKEAGYQDDTAQKGGINGDKAGYQPEQSGVSTGTDRGITVDTDNPPTSVLEPSVNPPLTDGASAAGEGSAHKPSDPKAEKPDLDAEFNQWWPHVPRKKSRGDARTAFKAARKKTDLVTLIAGMEASKRQWAAEGRAPSKIPYPATWLRAESWADEEDPQVPQQAGAQSSNSLAAWGAPSAQQQPNNGNTFDAWMPPTDPFANMNDVIDHQENYR